VAQGLGQLQVVEGVLQVGALDGELAVVAEHLEGAERFPSREPDSIGLGEDLVRSAAVRHHAEAAALLLDKENVCSDAILERVLDEVAVMQ